MTIPFLAVAEVASESAAHCLIGSNTVRATLRWRFPTVSFAIRHTVETGWVVGLSGCCANDSYLTRVMEFLSSL